MPAARGTMGGGSDRREKDKARDEAKEAADRAMVTEAVQNKVILHAALLRKKSFAACCLRLS